MTMMTDLFRETLVDGFEFGGMVGVTRFPSQRLAVPFLQILSMA